MSLYQIIVGVVMLVVFMALVLSKKVSVLNSLILVPIVFGLIAGFGTDTFKFAVLGMLDVGPTVAMLAFAILYFGIMLCVGLFDPLAGIVLKFMKGDPLRVILGTALLSALVSLDGDGTTTVMICGTALIPVYTRLKIDKVWLAIFIIGPNGIINLLPWGGPTARLLAVMPQVDSGELLVRLLPLMLAGLISVFLIAAYVGLQERKKLGIQDINIEAAKAELTEEELSMRRPKYIWFNLGLTLVVLLAIIAVGIPGPLVFAIGSAIALLVNYHNLKKEQKVIVHNAEGIIIVVVMIFGAGILMGMLSQSGLADAMATGMISIIPASWGKYFTFIVAVFGGPAVWILNNDAFYFGMVPVLAETARAYGFSDMQIALSTLLGQNLRGFSPVIASLYFLCSYVKIEFSDFQKKMIPICFILFAVYLIAGFFMGVYTLP